MKLTEHFTFDELVASELGLRHGIPNLPEDTHITGNLHVLARGLERVRLILNRPMVITSGYRSPRVNALAGGARESAHLSGLAADFRVPGMSAREVCLAIKDHASIGYQQLINEGHWTHVSFTDQQTVAPAMETLTAHFHGGRATYTKGIT